MRRVSTWKMKWDVARKYDSLADAYDGLYGEEQEAKIESAFESIQLRDSDVVLDVGCGTGLLFRHAEQHVGFIVGLDISRRLLQRARDRSKGSLKISLVRSDADYLPFIDETFDKIFAITVLQNVPDTDATLHEVTRIARKDAVLVLTGLKKSFTRERFLSLLHEAGLDVVDVKTDGGMLGFVGICRKENRYK